MVRVRVRIDDPGLIFVDDVIILPCTNMLLIILIILQPGDALTLSDAFTRYRIKNLRRRHRHEHREYVRPIVVF